MLPEGRAAVAIAAKGIKLEMIEVRLVFGVVFRLIRCHLDERSGAGSNRESGGYGG